LLLRGSSSLQPDIFLARYLGIEEEEYLLECVSVQTKKLLSK